MSPQLTRILQGHSTSCFIYDFVIQMISEKTLCNKHFIGNLRDILHENNRYYNSHKFSYKFAFTLSLSFLANQTQVQGFQ